MKKIHLTEKQKKDIKVKFIKGFKLALNILAYSWCVISIIAIIVSSSCSTPSKKEQSKTYSDNLPQLSLRDNRDFVSYYPTGFNSVAQPEDLYAGYTFPLWYDTTRVGKSSLNTYGLYWIYHSSGWLHPTYKKTYSDITTSSDIGMLFQLGTIENYEFGDFTLDGFTVTDLTIVGQNTDYDSFYLCAYCYHNNYSPYWAVVASFEKNNPNTIIFSSDNSEALFNKIFSGKYRCKLPSTFHPTYNGDYSNYFTWALFFNLNGVHDTTIDMLSLVSEGKWANLLNGTPIYSWLYGVSDQSIAISNSFIITGSFYYNGDYYNRIECKFATISNGDKVLEPLYSNTGSNPSPVTLNSGYVYNMCLKNISFVYMNVYGVAERSAMFLSCLEQHSPSLQNPYFCYNPRFLNGSQFTCFYVLSYNTSSWNSSARYLYNTYTFVNNFYYYYDDNGDLVVYGTISDMGSIGGNYFTYVFSWLNMALVGFLPFLNLYILPGISLGVLLLTPLAITLVLFVIKLFKR